MSFYASNDRIYITNSSGKVIFDTNKPMPHIIQTVSATVSVTFPEIPVTIKRGMTNIGPSMMCARDEYQCKNEYVCNWDPMLGQYVCGYEWVCNWVAVPYDRYLVWDVFDYKALEWEKTHEIATIENGLEADFLLVKAVATRTLQGELADIGGLPCGLPLGQTFVANNTSIIECMSDIRDGSPWMTRIMSVFVEGGKVKVQFKHSNRAFESVSAWDYMECSWIGFPPVAPGMPPPPKGKSAFTFDLNIVIGKFTK